MLDQGQKLRKFTKQIHTFCTANAADETLKPFIEPLAALLKDVGEVTMQIGMASMRDRDEAGAAASDYLRLIGHLTYGWLWARMAQTAAAHLDSDADGFYQAKITTARFYFTKLFPEVHALTARIKAGASPLMTLKDEHFAF